MMAEPIGRYGAVSPSNKGDCLCVYPEYVRVLEQSTSIHSATQLRDYGNKISDFSVFLGGNQSITTPEGDVFPLIIEGGLAYSPQRIPTDREMCEMKQVIIWNPTIYDFKCTTEEHLLSLPVIPAGTRNDMYDDKGNIIFSAEVDREACQTSNCSHQR